MASLNQSDSFIVMASSHVTAVADGEGYPTLDVDAVTAMAEHITYHLRFTINNAIKHQKTSRRPQLEREDVRRALSRSTDDPMLGLHETLDHTPVEDAFELYIQPDYVIDLKRRLSECMDAIAEYKEDHIDPEMTLSWCNCKLVRLRSCVGVWVCWCVWKKIHFEMSLN